MGLVLQLRNENFLYCKQLLHPLHYEISLPVSHLLPAMSHNQSYVSTFALF